MPIQAVRAPISHPVDIGDLRPTQITIGCRETETRAERLKKLEKDKLLHKYVIPVVKGPRGHFYVIDHHHLCRALLLAGSEQVLIVVVLDLQRLEKDEFWIYMDNSGLVHPFDEDGKRRDYSDIPKKIKDMADDPFRSLAGALRRKGGYAKDTTPFSEFLWAEFLRRRVDMTLVKKNFGKALDSALELAKKKESDHLPGWCGPVEEDA